MAVHILRVGGAGRRTATHPSDGSKSYTAKFFGGVKSKATTVAGAILAPIEKVEDVVHTLTQKDDDNALARFVIEHEDKKLGRHRTFFWVPTEIGFEHVPVDEEAVAREHGIPLIAVVTLIREQLDLAARLLNLPASVLLVISFAFMMIMHEHGQAVYGMKNAIDFDVMENANFAFVDPGAMGYKGMEDVNSYADFWSWMRHGLVPLVLREARPVSETPPQIDLGNLDLFERQFYLQHNRRIGGLQLQQSLRKPMQCVQSGNIIFNSTCYQEPPTNLYRQPDIFNLQIADFVPEESRTTLLSTYGNQTVQGQIDKLLQMEKQKWLTPETEQIQIRFLTFNAPLDVVTLTTIHFLFARSGHIWKEITYVTVLNEYGKHWSPWGIFWDLLFWLQNLLMIFLEIYEIVVTLRKHRRKFCAHYCNFWTMVDWTSYAWAEWLYAMWIIQIIHKIHIDDSLQNIAQCFPATSMPSAECNDLTVKLFGEINEINNLLLTNRSMCTVYAVIIMLRLFKAFSGQPKMAVIVNTMVASWTDVYHFTVVSIPILLSYAIAGNVLYGRELKEFMTLRDSLFTCLTMLFGSFDVDNWMQVNPIGTVLYFGSFCVLFIFILLNMLIAMLLEAGSAAKAASQDGETVVESFYHGTRRYIQNFWGTRLKFGIILKALEKAITEDTTNSIELKLMKPSDFVQIVKEQVGQGLPEAQAVRLLVQSAKLHQSRIQTEVSETEVMQAWATMSHKVSKKTEHDWNAAEVLQPIEKRFKGFKRMLAKSPKASAAGVPGPDAPSGANPRIPMAEELARDCPIKTLLRAANVQLEARAKLEQAGGSSGAAAMLKQQIKAAKACYTSLESTWKKKELWKI